MPRDDPDAALRSGPAGPDPRDGLWRFPPPHGDDHYFRQAETFHADRGYWPPGHPLRRREDEMQDRYGRATDAHPGARNLLLHLRQELYGMCLDGTLLAEGLDVRHLAREAAYGITAHVLRENMPPVQADVARVVQVTVTQLSPATWRDHFKLTYGHQWWLHWLVARRPAHIVERPQTRTVRITATFDLDRHRLYPRASASLVRQLGEPVAVVVPRPLTFLGDLGEWTP